MSNGNGTLKGVWRDRPFHHTPKPPSPVASGAPPPGGAIRVYPPNPQYPRSPFVCVAPPTHFRTRSA